LKLDADFRSRRKSDRPTRI